MRTIFAIVVAVAIVGGVSFARMFGLKVHVPAMRKRDAAVFFAMCLACAVIAQKGTNDPPRGVSAPCSEVAPGNGEDAIATSSRVSLSRGGAGVAVTFEDVDRMFSVMSVGTNEVFDFTMPAGATRVREWWLRGGCNDSAFIPGGVSLIGGELLDSLRNPKVAFCPLKATSLLVAGESEFWHQQTASNSTVYTWKDAYLWRNLSLPFSIQAEIFDNGDFEYRYDLSRISDMDALTNVVIGAKFGTNELGDVSWLLDGTNTVTSIRFHRLSEFDWDGDGRANEIDPDPYTNNGDCHGQGEGWVLASFTNSTEIISAGGYTNWVASVVENDTGGWWYSFTITANSFDATGHAVVRIDDKAVVLDRENDSATFLLMRGRGYPFSVDPAAAEFSAASYDGAQPQVEYSFGTGLVSIMAGVEILPHGATLHPIPGYSTAYFEAREWNLNPALDFSRSWCSAFGRLQITPAGDGGFVFWGGSTNELSDILYCDTYFDGYTNRQSVVVRYDPDPEPLPHVSLSSPNTIFVNDDDDNHNGTNDYLDLSCSFLAPDDDIVPVVVEFKSLAYVTNGTLRLSAQGLRIWENQNHNGTPVQSLTMTNCATPFERTLYVERDSLVWSQVGGCELVLEWLECEDSALGCATNHITAVEPIVEPIVSETFVLDGTNFVCNPVSVVVGGPKAGYRLKLYPADYPQEEIRWHCDNPDVEFVGGDTGTSVFLAASGQPRPEGQMESCLTVKIGDSPSVAPALYFTVVQPRIIKLHARVLSSVFAYNDPISTEALSRINGVFSQIGVRFVLEDHGTIKRDKTCVFDAENMASAMLMQEIASNDDGISVFLVDRIDNAEAFTTPIYNMVFVPRLCNWQLLAHELGHALGADDIYWSSKHKWPGDPVIKVDGPFDAGVVASSLDWNNGTGQRFYQIGLAHSELIERLLMYGVTGCNGVDIPHSSILGVASGGANGAKFEIRKSSVGRDAMNGENEL